MKMRNKWEHYNIVVEGKIISEYNRRLSKSEIASLEKSGKRKVYTDTQLRESFPQLYQEFYDNIQKQRGIKIVIICGKAGSGKDTIAKSLISKYQSFKPIISCTSRPQRDYELNGVNYNFLTDEDFQKDTGEWLEQTEFNGWHYGTRLQDLSDEDWNVGVFNPDGCRQILEAWDAGIVEDFSIFYVTTSDKERMMRQLDRENNPNVAEIVRRFNTDEEDFNHLDFGYKQLRNEEPQDIDKCVEIIAQDIFG